MKECKRCLEVKELSLFTFNKNCKTSRENVCKNCATARSAKWQKENKERKNKINANWRSLNIEQARKSSVDWGKNNKGHRNFLTKNRQTALLKRTPNWLTIEDKLHMLCLYQIAAMRSKYSDEKWHVDHIIPLQGKTVSGFHTPYNLQVIPAIDNLRKNNKYAT